MTDQIWLIRRYHCRGPLMDQNDHSKPQQVEFARTHNPRRSMVQVHVVHFFNSFEINSFRSDILAVRANIVQGPEDYFWSSQNTYLGHNEISWLTTNYGLSKFGKTIEEARISYSQYLTKIESDEELAELRNRFKDGQVLGEDNFLDEIREINSIQVDSQLPLKSILNAACCLMEIEEKLILSPSKTQSASYARGIISSIAKKEKIPVEEIAKQLGRDGSTISSLISRFSFRYANCPKTEDLIAKTIVKA